MFHFRRLDSFMAPKYLNCLSLWKAVHFICGSKGTDSYDFQKAFSTVDKGETEKRKDHEESQSIPPKSAILFSPVLPSLVPPHLTSTLDRVGRVGVRPPAVPPAPGKAGFPRTLSPRLSRLRGGGSSCVPQAKFPDRTIWGRSSENA